MWRFSQLSEQAQKTAVKEFIEDCKNYFDLDKGYFENTVYSFLSASKIHRFNQDGVLIGKFKKYQGKEIFVPGGMY